MGDSGHRYEALQTLLFVLFLLVAVGFVMFLQFEKRQQSKKITTVSTAVAAEAPQVITVGNRSYVPINLTGGSTVNARTILEAIQLFESLHNELHVTNFHVERNYHTPSSQWVTNPPEFIVGVWLTHEPR